LVAEAFFAGLRLERLGFSGVATGVVSVSGCGLASSGALVAAGSSTLVAEAFFAGLRRVRR
jgi:hypothetical protein